LLARATTGKGQAVDIAMSDSAMALTANVISRNPDLSKAPPRGRHRADIGIYRTSDDRFLVTTDMEPRYWQRFCEAMGRPDYAARQNDKAARPEIRAFLEAAFAEKPLAHWLALLGAADTQFAPISSIEEALTDPHNIARGMAITVDTEGGPVRQIGSPIHLSDTPAITPRPARIAGADNDDILKELGLS
jgi:crotonobetainyl-CoA:carnitine CoA-transferase CaiB-like acyl-CoA transferase